MAIDSRALLLALAVLTACGGDSVTNPSVNKAPTASAALVAATDFSCGLATSGMAYCWGANHSGQLGIGTTQAAFAPTPVAASEKFVAISGSHLSACALASTGGVWCWGQTPGTALDTVKTPALEPASPHPLRSLTVGRLYACGLDENGAAYCWGNNIRGQLGVGDTLPRATPTSVLGGLTFTQISAGFWHTCGITAAGATYCWGDNSFFEGGFGSGVSLVKQPTMVAAPQPFTFVAAGALQTCALTAAGAAYCWGTNNTAQLGDGTTVDRLTPTLVAGNLSFASIRIAHNNQKNGHACAITRDGLAYCWGENASGETGAAPDGLCDGGVIGPVPCNRTPARVAGAADVVAIEPGLAHTCAITNTGILMCWGENQEGELGDGTTTDRLSPAAISGGVGFPNR
ncbi:MAG TPA: hypothetical protein VFR41_09845 [Acidimicrobiia bacterium]|nr:hypothetical protein [Acidimicrobiia bacterium]